MERFIFEKKKFWLGLLKLALLAYVIKNIFVGADTDEGYGIVQGYRLAMGDRLLLEMWEPHQTSAIFTALFIRPFLWLTGGSVEFLSIYLRVMYFIVHSIIAWAVYYSFAKCKPEAGKAVGAGMALLFFVCSPKSIFVPEYSNLHIWFLTLFCVSLMWYYCSDSPTKNKIWILMLAGLWLTCDVLAYPSMAVLFPCCLAVFVREKRNSFWKELLAFALPCAIGVGIFMGHIFSYMTLEQLFQVIPHVLGDGSHQVGMTEKLLGYLMNMGMMALQLAGCAFLAWVMMLFYLRRVKRNLAEQDKEMCFFVCFFLANVIFMFYTWFTHVYNAGYTRLIYFAVAIGGLYCYRKGGRREKAGLYLILISLVNYVSVLALSNWTPDLLAPYLLMGAMGGLLCWNRYFVAGDVKLRGRIVPALCVLLTLSCCFGYCFRIIGGENIFEIRGINREGFRKGIFASYMSAYRYNMNQDQWAEIVPEGSNVLYVGLSQFSYMHGKCTVASPSTISTPTYGEELLAYWEMNPNRYPDVVLLESCYGDLGNIAGEEFLMNWLEKEFRASEVVDYPYVRMYRK